MGQLTRAVALVGLVGVGCSSPPLPTIIVESNQIGVTNSSDVRWERIEVWVNDHYRVTLGSLEPGGRFVAPLDTFVAGFGQRFDPRRQKVGGVEVTARDPSGMIVTHTWASGRRR